MLNIIAMIESYRKNEDGATAIEYGLIAAGVSLAISAVVFTFGADLQALFANMETTLEGAVTSTGATP